MEKVRKSFLASVTLHRAIEKALGCRCCAIRGSFSCHMSRQPSGHEPTAQVRSPGARMRGTPPPLQVHRGPCGSLHVSPGSLNQHIPRQSASIILPTGRLADQEAVPGTKADASSAHRQTLLANRRPQSCSGLNVGGTIFSREDNRRNSPRTGRRSSRCGPCSCRCWSRCCGKHQGGGHSLLGAQECRRAW